MKKKQKKMPLWVPVIWFICTGVWCTMLFVDLYCGYTSEGLVVMRALTALASLAAALANLWRWKRDKDDPDKV